MDATSILFDVARIIVDDGVPSMNPIVTAIMQDLKRI